MDTSDKVDYKKHTISTELLRQKLRDYALKGRCAARSKVNDSFRLGLGEIGEEIPLTEKDVQGIATRIKRRKHATNEDMYRLSYAFLQSHENINIFVNTPGANEVLIKELTGSNSERQISAIECFCNLSLGEEYVCEKICNAAGSYFVTYLDSSEERLKQTSLWTLCNLLATSIKCASTLLKMELLRKLWSIYICNESLEYCEDAAIALQLLCLKTKHLLSLDDHRFIIEKMMQKSPNSTGSEYLLQIIFNCDILKSSRAILLEEKTLIYLINFALSNLNGPQVLNSNNNCFKIIYSIRALANILATHKSGYIVLKEQLVNYWQSNFRDFFQHLFTYKEKELILEVFWLLRNVLEAIRLQHTYTTETELWLESLDVPQNIINIFQD